MLRLSLLGLLAGVLSFLLTPAVRRLALRLGAIDVPDERRVHRVSTPRLGGVALFVAMALAFTVAAAIDRFVVEVFAADYGRLVALGLGASVVISLGIYDDLRALGPGVKFAGQLLAAAAAVAGGGWIESFLGFDLPPWVAAPLMLLWVVAVTNAFNLIDGLDGLAAGVGLIASSSLAVVALYSGRPAEAVVLAVLAGALGGFLPYNFHPARIFLGDSGSLFLGFLLATLSIEASAKLPAMVAIAIPLLALGLPIGDTGFAVIRRLLGALHVVRRSETSERYEFFFAGSRAVVTADRRHIHHRLLELGLTQRNAVLLLYGVAVILCAVAFVLVFRREPNVGLWLAAFGVAAVVGIRRLGYGEIAILRNGVLLPLFDRPVVHRRIFHVAVDLGFVVTSYFLALLVWNEGSWGPEMARRFRDAAPLVAFTQISAFAITGLYSGTFRYVGLRDLLVFGRAIGLAVLVGWIALWTARGFEPPSLAVTCLDGYFLATLVVGSRLSFRVLEHLFKVGRALETRARRVLLYGAGMGGVLALREIESNPELGMRVVGFLDDDPRKCLRRVNGYPVFAPARLEEMIHRREFDEIVVSTHKLDPKRLRSVAERCAAAGLSVRRFSITWEKMPTADWAGTASHG